MVPFVSHSFSLPFSNTTRSGLWPWIHRTCQIREFRVQPRKRPASRFCHSLQRFSSFSQRRTSAKWFNFQPAERQTCDKPILRSLSCRWRLGCGPWHDMIMPRLASHVGAAEQLPLQCPKHPSDRKFDAVLPFAAGFEASAPPSSMEQPRSSQCPSWPRLAQGKVTQ